ncbi:hypothetical protein [Nannocystis pusilla]
MFDARRCGGSLQALPVGGGARQLTGYVFEDMSDARPCGRRLSTAELGG